MEGSGLLANGQLTTIFFECRRHCGCSRGLKDNKISKGIKVMESAGGISCCVFLVLKVCRQFLRSWHFADEHKDGGLGWGLLEIWRFK
jgi:hypothetical protein